MIDLNAPTTLEEIAQALKISKEAARKKAKDWVYSEKQMHGKNKLRLYALKDIPSEIMQSVLTYRMKEIQKYEQSNQPSVNPAETAIDRGDAGRVPLSIERVDPASSTDDVVDHERAGRVCNIASSGNNGRNNGHDSSGCAAPTSGDQTVRSGTDSIGRQAELVVNRKGAASDQLLDGAITHGNPVGVGQQAVTTVVDLSKTTEKQRKTDGARRYIVNFVENFNGSDTAAIDFLNHGYLAGTLTADLKDCYEHCNDKLGKGGKVRGRMEDQKLRIPYKPAIRADLRAVTKVTTTAGNIRFTAERSENGHADRFWALGLGVHAASNGAAGPAYTPMRLKWL